MYVNIYAYIISIPMDTNQIYDIYQRAISHSSEVPQTQIAYPLRSLT